VNPLSSRPQKSSKPCGLLLALASLLASCAASMEQTVMLEQEPGLLVIERDGQTLTSLGTSSPIDQLSLAGESTHFALSPSGAIGAISLQNEGRIQLLDITRMRRAQQIELGRDRKPADLEFIDEQRLLIGSCDDGAVSLFDSAFGHAHQQLDSGGQSATELVLEPESSTFWVLDTISGMIARMSWVRSAVQRSVHLAEDLTGLFHKESERELWTLSSSSDRIFILDDEDLSIKRELSCAGHPSSLAFERSGDVWVTCQSTNEIVKLDAETAAVKARVAIPLGDDGAAPHPTELLIDEEARLVRVVCPGSDSIQIIDMEIERCVANLKELRSPAKLTKSHLAQL
jgi:hypothetical protein